jgi:Gluconate 2-dehydrogenase subunit 3
VPDFREAGHLPNQSPGGEPPDPAGLPRQRRGTTPQMHGRYPDYDVLAEADHWDEATRRVVLDRVERVPPITFFTAEESDALVVFCDVLLAQDDEPRIPVLNYVDEKLAAGKRDGYRYDDMPDDGEALRIVAAGLDESARNSGSASFAAASPDLRHEIVHAFAEGEIRGERWDTLNLKHAWEVVTRYTLEAFYSHPWSWNEIGFGGPAYPRGYAAFGSPHLGQEAEGWEPREAFELDPVKDTQKRGLE